VTPKGQTRDHNTLGAQYLENSWRRYIGTTIANYWIVCYEAVWLAILATAWLLVDDGTTATSNGQVCIHCKMNY